MSVCLRLYVYVCMSVSLSVWRILLPVYLSVWIRLSVRRYLCLVVFLSMYLCVLHSFFTYVHLTMSVYVHLSLYFADFSLSVSLSFCLRLYLSIFQSLFPPLFVSLCLCLFLGVLVSLSVIEFLIWLCIRISVSLFVFHGFYVYICFYSCFYVYICFYSCLYVYLCIRLNQSLFFYQSV